MTIFVKARDLQRVARKCPAFTYLPPVPKSLREHNPSLEKYLGPTFVIPLRGKVDNPKLDYKEAVELLLKEAAAAALKDKGAEKATDAIRGLLDRKKKK